MTWRAPGPVPDRLRSGSVPVVSGVADGVDGVLDGVTGWSGGELVVNAGGRIVRGGTTGHPRRAESGQAAAFALSHASLAG
jgi:hypothetical protein